LRRKWAAGDRVTIDFDASLRAERFVPGRIAEDDPSAEWARSRWLKLGVIDENGEQTPNVSEVDLLPACPSVALCAGPVVLARDVRLGDEDISDPIPPDLGFGGRGELSPVAPPPDVAAAYEVRLSGGAKVHLCDFASAGNTWNRDSSDFRVWLPTGNS
jgi:hypothetical protein